jgi:redox-sensitive bicupin YhaK (pirin superfamily)
MQPGAHFKIPASAPALSRNLFHFLGGSLTLSSGPDPVTAVDSRTFPSSALGHKLRSDADVYLINGDAESELLLLQGKPISEPVAQYGPFVMNTESEIRQAFADYQRTQFGGWPFKSDEPTHERAQGRFARHSDGKIEVPGGGEAKGIARRRDEL